MEDSQVVRHPHPGDREAARRWAANLLDRTDWAILDTETTGLDADSEVIEVAVLAPDGTALLDTLVRPRGRVPPDATAIHGITEDMVADAPQYADVRRELAQALDGRTVISYNAAFDSRLLRQSAARHKAEPLVVQWQCAMEQYARYVGRWSQRYGSYVWQPLPHRPEQPGPRHRAMGDCRDTLDLIRTMAGTSRRST